MKDRPETEPEEAEVKERDYREKNKTSKAEVARAKEKGYEHFYGDLKENGPKNLYKLAKTRKRRSQDIVRERSYMKITTSRGDGENILTCC